MPTKAKIKSAEIKSKCRRYLKTVTIQPLSAVSNECKIQQQQKQQRKKAEKSVMHTENQNVNVIGEREHINWHEKRYA